MKKLVTFRLNAELLAQARSAAQRENRTLTNFVETVLKQALDEDEAGADRQTLRDSARRA